MSRMLLTLLLLLLFLTSRVGAQGEESAFLLILPVPAPGAQALATLETVLVAMGGHLQREQGSPTIVDAAWDAATRVRGTLIPTIPGHRPAAQWELVLACAKDTGGAKPLCQEVARRYRAQYP